MLQSHVGKILLKLLKIDEYDDVLDLGCGVGKLTKEIREITKGKVIVIDISEEMLKIARDNNKHLDILFDVKSAEEIEFKDCFDIIFCNSAFHWFNKPDEVLKKCYNALRKGEKIGIQAMAKTEYSPNFIRALEEVKRDPRTGSIFSRLRNPFFLLEREEDYKKLLKDNGFEVVISKIKAIKTICTPEDAFKIFLSGLAAAYLSKDLYEVEITDKYLEDFKEIIRINLEKQADKEGKLKLIFNRVFLIGIKN
ncbi:MAG: methyltransferase domain-containing protein [Brevinematia bacterium]